MEPCMITPTDQSCLYYVPLWPGRFCLAQWALKSQSYLDFYIRESFNQPVILDNGAFEEDMPSTQELLSLATAFQNVILVAPDDISEDAFRGKEKAIEFAREAQGVFSKLPKDHKLQIMYVPQCSRQAPMSGIDVLLSLVGEDTPFDIIGLCHNYTYNVVSYLTHSQDQEYNRTVWAAVMQQYSNAIDQLLAADYRFHLLGMGGNIAMLQYMWWADSIDTASIFWQSMLENKISRDGYLPTLPHRPSTYEHYTFTYTYAQQEALRHNATRVLYYASKARDLKRQIEGRRL